MNTIKDVSEAVDEALDAWRTEHAFAPVKFEVRMKAGRFSLIVRPLSIEWPSFDVELNEEQPAQDAHYMAMLILKDYADLIPPPKPGAGRVVTTSDIFGV